jgi:hypothetical protein
MKFSPWQLESTAAVRDSRWRAGNKTLFSVPRRMAAFQAQGKRLGISSFGIVLPHYEKSIMHSTTGRFHFKKIYCASRNALSKRLNLNKIKTLICLI